MSPGCGASERKERKRLRSRFCGEIQGEFAPRDNVTPLRTVVVLIPKFATQWMKFRPHPAISAAWRRSLFRREARSLQLLGPAGVLPARLITNSLGSKVM
jgi:hypothetical protein